MWIREQPTISELIKSYQSTGNVNAKGSNMFFQELQSKFLFKKWFLSFEFFRSPLTSFRKPNFASFEVLGKYFCVKLFSFQLRV